MHYKGLKFIFFLESSSPSDDELAVLKTCVFPVIVRNGSAVADTDPVEVCDGVFGKVPGPYSKLPNAIEVLRESVDTVEVMLMGDKPAMPAAEAPTKPATGRKGAKAEESSKPPADAPKTAPEASAWGTEVKA